MPQRVSAETTYDVAEVSAKTKCDSAQVSAKWKMPITECPIAGPPGCEATIVVRAHCPRAARRGCAETTMVSSQCPKARMEEGAKQLGRSGFPQRPRLRWRRGRPQGAPEPGLRDDAVVPLQLGRVRARCARVHPCALAEKDRCFAWGDPHTTTFDGLAHHFESGPLLGPHLHACAAAVA